MPQKKNNSRLEVLEAQKRAAERQDQRIKRWQQVAFIAISVIVLLSMVLTLFINP
jgi:hypothetical protein